MTIQLAEVTGNIASAFGLLGAALGVGLIGLKAAEAVGRRIDAGVDGVQAPVRSSKRNRLLPGEGTDRDRRRRVARHMPGEVGPDGQLLGVQVLDGGHP